MKLRITFSLLFVAIAIHLHAQPTIRRGLLRYEKMVYRLADDGSRIAFMNRDSTGPVFYSILDLNSFSVKKIQPHPCLAYNSRLDGNLKGYMVNSTPGWASQTCREISHPDAKYTTTFFGTIGNSSIKTYVDNFYSIGLLKEGMLVSNAYFTDKGSDYEIACLVGLRIINPATGALVRTLQTDTVINRPDKRPVWATTELFSFNDRYLQVRTLDQYYRYFPLNGGPPFTVYHPMGPMILTGGLSVYTNYISTAKNSWLKLYDIAHAKFLADTIINATAPIVYCAVGDTIYHYRSDEATLYKELLTASGLYPITTYRLDTTGAQLTNANAYEGVVAKGKLVIFPTGWRQPGQAGNEMYVWDIRSGRQVLKIVDFFNPDAKFLAMQAENNAFFEKFSREKAAEVQKLKEANRPKTCEELWKAAPFHPGDYISLTDKTRMYDYSWALVTGYDCNKRTYTLLTSRTGTDAETHEMGEAYFSSGWRKGGTPYIRCPECNGNSRWKETYRERVGWEQVNFNVYVKDDRRTQQVTREFVCQRCKGAGWIRQ